MTGSSDCSVAEGTVHSGAGVVEHFAAGGTECFGATFLVAPFDHCHPNLLCALPHFCKWGSAVPMNNLLQPALGLTIAQGITAT